MESTTINLMETPPTPAAPGGRLIVGHVDDGFVSRVCRHFQEMGWEVHPAETADEVRRQAAVSPASVVILPTEFHEESGWLTCAKLVREHPQHRIILVGEYTTPTLQRYTNFVGGTALLGLDSSMRSLVDEVYAAAQLPLAN
jgi:hypothetical protein